MGVPWILPCRSHLTPLTPSRDGAMAKVRHAAISRCGGCLLACVGRLAVDAVGCVGTTERAARRAPDSPSLPHLSLRSQRGSRWRRTRPTPHAWRARSCACCTRTCCAARGTGSCAAVQRDEATAQRPTHCSGPPPASRVRARVCARSRGCVSARPSWQWPPDDDIGGAHITAAVVRSRGHTATREMPTRCVDEPW